MPSKNAWPVPRRRRVVGVRIQKGWFYGIKRLTLVLFLALGLFKLSAIKAFIRRKAAVAGLFT